MIEQFLTNLATEVLRPGYVPLATWWILAALVVWFFVGAVLPNRLRNSLVLTVYDIVFGIPFIVVQVAIAQGCWYKLCERGLQMWLGRVSSDKAEHVSGKWFPCLMTQRFNYPALKYQGEPETVAEHTTRVDVTENTKIERAFAEHYGGEDAALFVSGFVSNLEALGAIASMTPDVLFLWDRDCHRSLYEGFRMHRNQSFPHNDFNALEEVLKKETPNSTVWVVTESPFSMEGGTVDAAKLLQLRETYGARLYIDLAHSLGVEEDFADFDVRIMSLSKCAGLYGGVLIGPQPLVSWIRANGNEERRSYPARSIPPVRKFLQWLDDGTVAKKAKKVHDVALFAYDTLSQAGWSIHSPRGSYILCVQIASPFSTLCMQQWCLRHGVYLAIIGYPALQWKRCLGYRICITAAMTKADVKQIVDTMGQFISPFTVVDVVRYFFNPKNWGFGEPNTGLSSEPLRGVNWGEGAARLLGGNTLEQLHLERALATAYGCELCSICSDSELGIRDWKRLIPSVTLVQSLDEVEKAEDGEAVMVRMKPFGLALFCKRSDWKEEFWLRQKMLLHSTAVPSYLFLPYAQHKGKRTDGPSPIEQDQSETE